MIQCKNCGSENVQRLSIVFDGGLSDLNATESGAGVGFGSGGLGVGFGSSKIKGSNQSRLSQKAAPPEKKKIIKHFCIWGIGLFIVPPVVVSVLGWGSSVAQFLTVLSYLGAAGLHIYSDIQYNRRIYPSLFTRWDASFLCHKCGEVFQNPAARSQSDSNVLGTSV